MVASFLPQIQSTQKYVDEVRFHDGTKIQYILSNSHPEYGNLSGTKLNSIKFIQPNGALHKQVSFSYTTSAHNRLFLTGIDEVYGSETLHYTLDYINLDELPSFGSKLKDRWGYYNGNNNNTSNTFISTTGTVNTRKIITGLLSAITYPLGGKKEFTFVYL